MTTSPAPQQSFNLFSILAIVFVWFTGILGLVFGYIALSQIKQTGERGRGLALASVIIGWIGVAFFAVWLIIVVIGLGIVAADA